MMALSVSMSTVFAEEVNLLTNGSFESSNLNGGWSDWGVPNGWNALNWDGGYHGYGTTGSVTMKDGAQVALFQKDGLWQNTGIQMVAGKTYTLSSYAVSEKGGNCFGMILYAAATPDAAQRGNLLVSKNYTPSIYTSGWGSEPLTLSYTCDAVNAGKYLQALIYEWGHDYNWVDQASLIMESLCSPVFTPGDSVIFGLKPMEITITCLTSGATIRYTTDNSDPTLSNGTEISSGDSVTINVNTTLKARAFSDGHSSQITSVTYTIPSNFNRPTAIAKSDSIMVDGNLGEWPDCDFIPLDKNYDGSGAMDVPEASYAAKWSSSGKIYMAVKVRDTAHIFTENYTDWNARDAIEVYLHTQGSSGSYSGSWEIAQQYAVGIKSGTTDQVWSSLANTGSVPASANFQAAGKVNGEWIYYECALTAFDYFGGYLSKSSEVAALNENDVIGLDVCVVSNNGSYTGMKGENTQTGKSTDFAKFGLHKLVTDNPFLTLQWGPVTPNGSSGSAYYLNNNLVNGHVVGGTIGNGPWELDKSGTMIHSLSNTSTAKSVVKVGDYIYYTYSGGSDVLYRSSADTWDAPGTVVTISDNQAIVSLATDGTNIYASTTKNSGTSQVSKYSVDAASGALTLVWTTTGIEATGIRGLSYYHGAADYIYAVSGGRNTASVTGNTAHIYAIGTDTGTVTDMGAITDNGETYQVVRVGKQLWVTDALTGSTNDSQIYVYGLTNDTTLFSTTPTTVCNPDGIGQIFGMAIDGNFVWLTGPSGEVYGYKFNKIRLAGDANEDDMVDVGDLGILAANYSGSGKTWSQGDFNNDGLVDVGDLGILAAHYGEGVNTTLDFITDYAKAFGTTVADGSADETAGSICSGLGLPLVAGLMFAGLCLLGGAKWKE
jgi:hypothetical protein